jgi:hypothetical protein
VAAVSTGQLILAPGGDSHVDAVKMHSMLEAARLVSAATYSFHYRRRAEHLELLLNPDPTQHSRSKTRKGSDNDAGEAGSLLLVQLARRQKLLTTASRVIKDLVNNILSTFFVFWRGKVLKHTDDLFAVSEKERDWYKDKGLAQRARSPSGETLDGTITYGGNLARHDDDEDEDKQGSGGTRGRDALGHGACKGWDDSGRSQSPAARASLEGKDGLRSQDTFHGGVLSPNIISLFRRAESVCAACGQIKAKCICAATASSGHTAGLDTKSFSARASPRDNNDHGRTSDEDGSPHTPSDGNASSLLCQACGMLEGRCFCLDSDGAGCGQNKEVSFVTFTCPPVTTPACAHGEHIEEECICPVCDLCWQKQGGRCAICGQAQTSCTCAECGTCGHKTQGSFAACTCPHAGVCELTEELWSCHKTPSYKNTCPECGLALEACTCSSRRGVRHAELPPKHNFLRGKFVGEADDDSAGGKGRGGGGLWSSELRDHLPGFVYPMMVARYDAATDYVSIGLDSGAHFWNFWNAEFTKIQTRATAPASLALSQDSSLRRQRAGVPRKEAGAMIVPKEMWEKLLQVRQEQQVSCSRLRSLHTNTARGSWVKQMRPCTAAAVIPAKTPALIGRRAMLNPTSASGREETRVGDGKGEDREIGARGVGGAWGEGGHTASEIVPVLLLADTGGSEGGAKEHKQNAAQKGDAQGGERRHGRDGGATQANPAVSAPSGTATRLRVPALPLEKWLGASKYEGLHLASAKGADTHILNTLFSDFMPQIH